MAPNPTIIILLSVLNGMVLLGCDGPMGDRERRIALKIGLDKARQAHSFETLKQGETPDPDRLKALFDAVLSSTIQSTQKTLYRLKTSLVIPSDGPEGFRMTDHIEVAMESPNRWRVVHHAEWMSNGLNRDTGRRCSRLDGRFFIGSAHGPMTELIPQAREDQSCLRRSLGTLHELLTPIAGHISSQVQAMDGPGQSSLLRISFEGKQTGEPLPIPMTWPSEPTALESKGNRARGHLFAERGRLDRVSGSLIVHGQTQQLVSAEVRTEIRVRKIDRDAQLVIEIKIESSPFNAEIPLPDKIVKATKRPRIFKDMKSLLGLDFKAGAQRTLPKPGDAPKLRVSADGRLTSTPERKTAQEDQPSSGTQKPELQDEDLPR